MACLLVAASDVRGQLDGGVNTVAQWGADDSERGGCISSNVNGMNNFLFQYVPALFLLGTTWCVTATWVVEILPEAGMRYITRYIH